MPVLLGGRGHLGEQVDLGQDAPSEIGVRGVHAGVDDGDDDAGALARGPGIAWHRPSAGSTGTGARGSGLIASKARSRVVGAATTPGCASRSAASCAACAGESARSLVTVGVPIRRPRAPRPRCASSAGSSSVSVTSRAGTGRGSATGRLAAAGSTHRLRAGATESSADAGDVPAIRAMAATPAMSGRVNRGTEGSSRGGCGVLRPSMGAPEPGGVPRCRSVRLRRPKPSCRAEWGRCHRASEPNWHS